MAKRSAPPRPLNNLHEREHEWITYDEFKAIHTAAANTGRHGQRGALMLLQAFRHCLRAAELTRLKWKQVDLQRRTIVILRVKRGKRSTHDLSVEEVKELRELTPNDADRFGHVYKSEHASSSSTRSSPCPAAIAAELALQAMAGVLACSHPARRRLPGGEGRKCPGSHCGQWPMNHPAPAAAECLSCARGRG
jgi:integrase